MLEDGHAIVVQGYARPGRAIVASENSVPLNDLIREHGKLALPHYINREVNPADADDYQTVYASHEGAIAAPTAGLHFTDEVFRALAEVGVRRAFVTLHIGPGTFAPLRSDVVEQHSMEAEWYVIPPETAEAIAHGKRTGGRIIAVGTQQRAHAQNHMRSRATPRALPGCFIHPGFPLQAGRRDDHQFPYATHHGAGAGDGDGGAGENPRGVSRGGAASVPFPELRRRDVDSMTTIAQRTLCGDAKRALPSAARSAAEAELLRSRSTI